MASAASAAQRGGVFAIDPSSATAAHAPLLHWKGVAQPARHGVSCTASSTHAAHDGGTGGTLCAIEADKAVLVLYSWQRDQPIARIVLPQKMTCASLSPQGTWVATGTVDGRLFVWDVASGALLTSFEAHYRAMTTIAWTSDSAAIVTASQDTRVCVWSWPSLMQHTDLTGSGSPVAPYATWSDHTLDLTAVHVTPGAFPHHVRVWTASRDHTVKVWDAGTRMLVSTYAFDAPITSIAVDPLERYALVADERRVMRLDLYVDGTFRGGRASAGVSVRVQDAPHVEVGAGVTTMAISVHGTHAAIGTWHGTVPLIDITTLQTIRTLAPHASSRDPAQTPVTYLHILPRPTDLATHTQLRAKKSATESVYLDALPMPCVASQFERTIQVPSHAWMRLGHVALDEAQSDAAEMLPAEPVSLTAPSVPAPDERLHTLEAQVQRAKALNDEMWQRLVEMHSRTG